MIEVQNLSFAYGSRPILQNVSFSLEQGERVPEKNLLLLAVVGGSVGALLGMYLFRHKTLHRVFRVGVPVILAVQLLLAAAITLYWNFLR